MKNFINKKYIVVLSIAVTFFIVTALIFSTKDKGVFFNEKRKVPIYSVDTKEKKVAITFDSNWGDDNTKEILDILDKYHVKATFFLVGAWIDDFPDKAKEIHKRGHEIGNHSNMHPDMTKVSKSRMMQEIQIADNKIMKITGTMPKLFRCPSGSYNDQVIKTVEETNHYCIQWNADSIDWKGQGADIEYNRIMKKVKPGSIMLFHNDGKYTPQNLPRIIENLKREGYEFVEVSKLIYKDNYHIDHSGAQVPN